MVTGMLATAAAGAIVVALVVASSSSSSASGNAGKYGWNGQKVLSRAEARLASRMRMRRTPWFWSRLPSRFSRLTSTARASEPGTS